MNTIKPGEIAIQETKLSSLLDQIENLKKDRKQLYEATVEAFTILGMVENGEIQDLQKFGFMSIIRKNRGLLMAMLSGNEKLLSEKFAFLKELMPLFKKIQEEIKNEQ